MIHHISLVTGACLVIDDAPGVGDDAVVVAGKGVVAGAGGSKAVAHHLHLRPASLQKLLPDVIRCQSRQCTSQRVPCMLHG